MSTGSVVGWPVMRRGNSRLRWARSCPSSSASRTISTSGYPMSKKVLVTKPSRQTSGEFTAGRMASMPPWRIWIRRGTLALCMATLIGSSLTALGLLITMKDSLHGRQDVSLSIPPGTCIQVQTDGSEVSQLCTSHAATLLIGKSTRSASITLAGVSSQTDESAGVRLTNVYRN